MRALGKRDLCLTYLPRQKHPNGRATWPDLMSNRFTAADGNAAYKEEHENDVWLLSIVSNTQRVVASIRKRKRNVHAALCAATAPVRWRSKCDRLEEEAAW